MKSDELDGKRETKVDLLFAMCPAFLPYLHDEVKLRDAMQRIPRKERKKKKYRKSIILVR